MSFFNYYPYTDFHELNLDWILKNIKAIEKEFDDFKVVNSIRWSGKWDITKAYPKYSIVDNNGNGYISVTPVPAGVDITNEKYWVLVANYSALFADFQNRLLALENDLSDVKNVLNFGAVGDGVTDDTDAIQSAINACHTLETVLLPANKTYKLDNGIILNKPIRFICNGSIVYNKADGACITVSSDTERNMDNSYIHIANLLVSSQYGNSGQPDAVNTNGNIGLKVNKYISSEIDIGRVMGFTYCGVFLNGSGDLGLNQQIILHDRISINTVANCGYGLYMLSKDAATHCVEANEINVCWCLQCFDGIKIDNDSDEFQASTSNLFIITAVDNAKNHGIQCNSKWNKFIVGFMSTFFVFGVHSSNNDLTLGNNFSTDASIADFGTANRYSTAMPASTVIPARTTPTVGDIAQNNNGVSITCYLRCYTNNNSAGNVDIGLGKESTDLLPVAKFHIPPTANSSGFATTFSFRVPAGWHYQITPSSNVVAQYISFIPE